MKEDKIMFLDGSNEEQEKIVKDYLNTLSEEEHIRAMSDEFAYLDGEPEE